MLGVLAYQLGIHGFGMTPPAFLVSVPIPFIFGSLSQPVKGVASAAIAAVLGVLLAQLYRLLMPLVTGDLPAGPPTFDPELWLANALLAVTFPFLAFYGDFFQLWPLARASKEQEAVAEPAAQLKAAHPPLFAPGVPTYHGRNAGGVPGPVGRS